MVNGGYDDGYKAAPCFWGTEPASLVRKFLRSREIESLDVLDLGCGEGKNANAFAALGARVDAVDCSELAINNGRIIFANDKINWINQDILEFGYKPERYDVVISYGVVHCLSCEADAKKIIYHMKKSTKVNGFNILCSFNNRSQDLIAHPGFRPLLLDHLWYRGEYADWRVLEISDQDLHETHPHNNIPHHHSLTRILAQKL